MSTRRAVVDIGSNSVRLVIYEGPPRCPVSVFNEKMLCGLGSREKDTGLLRSEAVEGALSVLSRFSGILRVVQPDETHVFATAAVREAPNGASFLASVQQLGLSPRLLSGEEEAEMAALGILSCTPALVNGTERAIAGDIGGGSLELSVLAPDQPSRVGERISLPLGALRLQSDWGEDRTGARAHIDSVVESVRWLSGQSDRKLYAVGGAWRALARIEMLHDQYPIDILDGYYIPAKKALRLCEIVSHQSVRSLESIPGGQRRRAPTLPFAAMVLSAVIHRSGVAGFEISASGVREGILFDALDPETKKLDPLMSLSAHARAMHGAVLAPDPADTVPRITEALGYISDEVHRWLKAAAILVNVSTPLQPDARASHAARLPMSLPLRGISHAGRLFLAVTVGTRHGADEEELSECVPLSLLEDDLRTTARAAGLAFRFLAALAPGGGAVLREGHFVKTGQRLSYRLPNGSGALWGASPQKRLDRLATALGLEASIPA